MIVALGLFNDSGVMIDFPVDNRWHSNGLTWLAINTLMVKSSLPGELIHFGQGNAETRSGIERVFR